MYDEEIIDDYILGKLNTKEKKRFEETLQSDTSLQTLLKERKELIHLAKLVGATSAKEKMKQLVAETRAKSSTTDKLDNTLENTVEPTVKTTGRRIQLIPMLLAAACITALCYLLLFNTTPELNPLVNEYYAPYSVTVRSSDNANIKEKAYQLYNNKAYMAALPLLKEVAPNNDEAQLLLGISQFETGQLEEAIRQFETLTGKESLFSDHAKWYAALTHIQLEQTAKAKAILNNLASQTEYSTKAKALLNKLKIKSGK